MNENVECGRLSSQFPLERAYIGTYDDKKKFCAFFFLFDNSEEEQGKKLHLHDSFPFRPFSSFSQFFVFSSPPFESDDDAADSDMLLWVE
jgi:hypothetical protein